MYVHYVLKTEKNTNTYFIVLWICLGPFGLPNSTLKQFFSLNLVFHYLCLQVLNWAAPGWPSLYFHSWHELCRAVLCSILIVPYQFVKNLSSAWFIGLVHSYLISCPKNSDLVRPDLIPSPCCLELIKDQEYIWGKIKGRNVLGQKLKINPYIHIYKYYSKIF